ncbi:MAG: HAMP domain-containing sensor histidine kinase [Cyanobacteria bacterium]|nr:HAMP domain-containing sensor histidine kinase [Cyanobacteriota bacterium]
MDWFSTLTGIGIGLLLIVLRGRPDQKSLIDSPNNIRSPNPMPQGRSETIAPTDYRIAYYSALDLAQFKGSFLSRASHELRSPLNALISSLQMIQAGLCDDVEEEKEYVGFAHDAALKFIGLLDEVLKVSKLQSGSLNVAKTEVNLTIVLQEVYFMTRHLAANRNLRLQIPMLDDEILIQADSTYLQQALTILVSRSIAAMEEGSIILSLSTEGKQVTLTLQDELPEEQWQETLNVLTNPNASLPQLPAIPAAKRSAIGMEFSPSFRLLLARELLSIMGISLSVDSHTAIETNTKTNTTPRSIQCHFHLA